MTDLIAEELLFMLTSHVLGHKVETIDHPVHYEEWASWWQHTKAVLFPTFSRWMRRPPRRVGRTITTTIDKYLTFPEATIAYPPELRNPVVQVMWRGQP